MDFTSNADTSKEKQMNIVTKLRDEFSFVRGNYLILIISWILMDFAGEMPALYYGPFVMYDLGATAPILGFIGFVSILVLAAVQFPGGYLADRYGRKWLISTLTFGVALSFIFHIVAPSWHWILVGALIGNLCLIYQPALMAMVADSTSPEKRGMAFSIATLIANVATTPAPIVAGTLVAVYTRAIGMRISYTIVVLFYFFAAVLRSRLKETIKTEEEIKPRDLIASYPQAIRESVAVWKTVPRSMFFLLIANLIITFGLSLGQLFFAVYAVEGEKSVLNLTQIEWALVQTALFITMIVSAIPIGKTIDRINRKIPLLLAHMTFIPGVLFFVYGNFGLLFIAMILIGITQLLFFASFSSLQADLVPREKRAKVIGFSQFLSYILMAFGMLAGGIFYSFNPQLPFLLMIALVIPSAIVIALMVHEPAKREAG
jgi:MFS family permease